MAARKQPSTTTRILPRWDFARIEEIDRSEHVTQEYTLAGESLQLREVDIRVPPWSKTGDHEHSVRGKLAEWGPLLDAGGTLVGALAGDRLVGFSIYRPDLEPEVGQLAVLYVSAPRRGSGVGAALCDEVAQLARSDGARELYVSSTPTVATVRFYQGQGYAVTSRPSPELLALEPDDIHMRRRL